MYALKFIPGAVCGPAVMDGSLQLIGNGETDDTKCFFVLFVPLIDLLRQLVLLSSSEGYFLSVGTLYRFDIIGSSVLAINDFPDFLFREEHSTLEGPRMVHVVAEFLDAIAASVGIFGRIVCHRWERTIGLFKRVDLLTLFERMDGIHHGLALTRAHNLLNIDNFRCG